MKKEKFRIPHVGRIGDHKKNPSVFNKKFDIEINPITNWHDPDWLILDDYPEEQQWFREANEGKEHMIWHCYYFKVYRRIKGFWCWLPYESMGRSREEAMQGLIASTAVLGPRGLKESELKDSTEQEFRYLLGEVRIIDKHFAEYD